MNPWVAGFLLAAILAAVMVADRVPEHPGLAALSSGAQVGQVRGGGGGERATGLLRGAPGKERGELGPGGEVVPAETVHEHHAHLGGGGQPQAVCSAGGVLAGQVDWANTVGVLALVEVPIAAVAAWVLLRRQEVTMMQSTQPRRALRWRQRTHKNQRNAALRRARQEITPMSRLSGLVVLAQQYREEKPREQLTPRGSTPGARR